MDMALSTRSGSARSVGVLRVTKTFIMVDGSKLHARSPSEASYLSGGIDVADVKDFDELAKAAAPVVTAPVVAKPITTPAGTGGTSPTGTGTPPGATTGTGGSGATGGTGTGTSTTTP